MVGPSQANANGSSVPAPGEWFVIKRDHSTVAFDRQRIFLAIEKAFVAVMTPSLARLPEVQGRIQSVTDLVQRNIVQRYPQGGHVHVEEIQDNVIACLLASDFSDIGRVYATYRSKRQQERDAASIMESPVTASIDLMDANGHAQALDYERWRRQIREACERVSDVDETVLEEAITRNMRDGMSPIELAQVMVDAATDLIKHEPSYDTVAARLLLIQLRDEAMSRLNLQLGGRSFRLTDHADLDDAYGEVLKGTLNFGVQRKLLDPRLLQFKLDKLGQALVATRDLQFDFHGLQVLYDRYVLQWEEERFELPQVFWMRIAMFLALDEPDREDRAIEFYDMLSSFRFVCSTPTLFNAGTLHPQLSSCYISTVEDDLASIFGFRIFGNAMLQKWAGGMGNDWTPIRALGTPIEGTHGKSEGVIPFIKVVDSTAKAVNQGGKRAGAVCSYLETWHLDVEEFLDLRKNTGDPMRRTPNMNTANWIPDLFMERVETDGEWTLFSPSDVPDLHDLFGSAFKVRYEEYERAVDRGEIRLFKRLKANDLFKSMLRALAETGHPWITFKDPCNIRSPQRHVGRVHSSNLCTEITLNTSKDEIAVCNLGSVNLLQHVDAFGEIELDRLRETVHLAVRMLDNVIDLNFYAMPEAANSNRRHRPIGLGIMGFQDVLYIRREPYDSDAALEFADRSMEWLSYYTIEASSELAKERGSYESFPGSLWDQDVLPIDSLKLLANERAPDDALLDYSQTAPWQLLRDAIREHGMRNSNVLAIAPTATIANIAGVVASIEPFFRNTFVKQNMSGDFLVVNPYLTQDLKNQGLWSNELYEHILAVDGDLSQMEALPEDIKSLYKSAFEIGNAALIECAARRQKWIDQSQSLNLYVDPNLGVTPREVKRWYVNAWKLGLKTTYYLHSRSATNVEKTSSVDQRLRFVDAQTSKEENLKQSVAEPTLSVSEFVQPVEDEALVFCDINDPTCESCAG